MMPSRPLGSSNPLAPSLRGGAAVRFGGQAVAVTFPQTLRPSRAAAGRNVPAGGGGEGGLFEGKRACESENENEGGREGWL
jgi:hypothetical protein